MNIRQMRLVKDFKDVCNILLISRLYVLGGGKSKRFKSPLYPVKLTYDFTPVSSASGGISCVQPYLI